MLVMFSRRKWTSVILRDDEGTLIWYRNSQGFRDYIKQEKHEWLWKEMVVRQCKSANNAVIETSNCIILDESNAESSSRSFLYYINPTISCCLLIGLSVNAGLTVITSQKGRNIQEEGRVRKDMQRWRADPKDERGWSKERIGGIKIAVRVVTGD